MRHLLQHLKLARVMGFSRRPKEIPFVVCTCVPAEGHILPNVHLMLNLILTQEVEIKALQAKKEI